MQTIAGAGLVSIATWCYHFYKQQNLVLEHYQAVSDFEEVELSDGDAVPHEHEKENQGLLAQQDSTTMEPTPFRVTALVLFVIFLAVATMLFRSPVSPQPQG